VEIRKILITGGTGFFGLSLLRLYKLKYGLGDFVPEVYVLSRSPEDFLNKYEVFKSEKWLNFICGDVMIPNSLPKNMRFSHIIHAATDSTLGPTQKPIYRFDQIVGGTRNMLNYAVEQNVKRFLFTSSGGVYGPQPIELEGFPETYLGMPDPLNFKNAYSIGKRMSEHLCALYNQAGRVETIIARCFSFVGPDLPQNVHFAVGNFVYDALNLGIITVVGDGKPQRSYMHQQDLADWLIIILKNGIAGKAYNVGSDKGISIKELAFLVRKLLNPEALVNILGNSDKDQLRDRYIPDISRAKTELNLKVSVSLEEAILSCQKKRANN